MCLLAQADWLGIAASAANVGFSVAVGIYLLTKAIPAMQASHREEREAERDAFIAELKQKREDFLNELKEMTRDTKVQEKERRTEYREALKAVTDHCERESERRDKLMQVELVALSNATEEQARVTEGMSEAVKDFREVLHRIVPPASKA